MLAESVGQSVKVVGHPLDIFLDYFLIFSIKSLQGTTLTDLAAKNKVGNIYIYRSIENACPDDQITFHIHCLRLFQ